MKDDKTMTSTGAARKPRRMRRTNRTGTFQAAAVLLTILSLVAAVGCWLQPPHKAEATEKSGPVRPTHEASPLFQTWPKTQPLAVLVFTSQIHGYLNPCGCSEPQYGGFERFYNFVQQLKDRGWPVTLLDGGDIAQTRAPAELPNIQGIIKYRYSMEAKEAMGTTAVGFGADDAKLSLFLLAGEWALNNEQPAVLLGNLENRQDFPADKREGNSAFGLWRVTQPSKDVKIGVVGVVSTHEPEKDVLSVGDQISQFERGKYKFAPTDKAVKQALAEMNKAEKPNFRVLLYQGSFEKAKKVAEMVPDFNVILCLDDADEPPENAVDPSEDKDGKKGDGKTIIVRVGHKGKSIGIVGLFPSNKAGQPFEMKYQRADVGPQYATPAAKRAAQPIVKIMERYQKELRSEGYLEKYSQKPHEVQIAARALKNAAGAPRYPKETSDYVGSETCKKCHTEAYDTWKVSPHSPRVKDGKPKGPYQTLAEVTNPGNRIFDAECIVCHTTGFTHDTGYSVKFDKAKPGTIAEEKVNLRDVGCESCHGPSGLHARNPKDKDLQKIINPWGGNYKNFEKMCMQCHDHENDVKWTINKWWTGKIFHGNGQDRPPEEAKP